MLKKLLFIFMILIIFSGCSDSLGDDIPVFSLNEDLKKIYNEQIKSQLAKYSWNYSEGQNVFEPADIPNNKTANYDMIKEASFISGVDMSGFENREAVRASVSLMHFNNDLAGTAYFYFYNDKIVCQYYVYNSKVYSLKDRNVFENEITFTKFEDTEIKRNFKKREMNLNFQQYSDYSAMGSMLAVISEHNVDFYKYDTNKFNLKKSVSFSGDLLYPIDTTFFNDGGGAVLLGRKIENTNISDLENTGEFEITETTEKERLLSEKIVFFDNLFNFDSSSILLESPSYTTLAYDNGTLIAGMEKSVDLFVKEDSIYVKKGQYYLNHGVNKIRTVDFETDGNIEYIISDGMNLFLYKAGETLELIWRTHFSVQMAQNNVFAADLNGDGVKEIYAGSKDGIVEKYILTERGFAASGTTEDLSYGSYITGDFNSDGLDDFIFIDKNTGKQNLYIALK